MVRPDPSSPGKRRDVRPTAARRTRSSRGADAAQKAAEIVGTARQHGHLRYGSLRSISRESQRAGLAIGLGPHGLPMFTVTTRRHFPIWTATDKLEAAGNPPSEKAPLEFVWVAA